MKNQTALLGQTRDSLLTIHYSIDLADHKLSSTQPCCFNCTRKSASCLHYKLEDIVKSAENNDQEYEELAKTGAIIEIIINWKCHKPFYRSFDPSRDCEVGHSISRTDRQDVNILYVSILERVVSLSHDDKFKTARYYYLLRLVVIPRAKLTYFSFYRFITNCFAYYGPLIFVIWVYKKFVRSRISHLNDNLVEVVYLGQSEQAVTVQNQVHTPDSLEEEKLNESVTENTPLINQVINTE